MGRHHRDPSILMPSPARLKKPRSVGECLGHDYPKHNDDVWVHEVDLCIEKHSTRIEFRLRWSARLWRVTLHEVGDVHIGQVKPSREDHLLQHLPHLPRKRYADGVIRIHRNVSDDHDVRALCTTIDGGVATNFRKRARNALTDDVGEVREGGEVHGYVVFWFGLLLKQRRTKPPVMW